MSEEKPPENDASEKGPEAQDTKPARLEFVQRLGTLIEAAQMKGVTPVEIVGTLECMKFELLGKIFARANAQQRQRGIVPSGVMPGFKPKAAH